MKKNVFSSQNFRLVFFGALVSELGAILYSFAVSFYILEISNNSAFLQGLYLAVCGIAMLISTPVGGVIGDRFNKAKIMFLCDYIKGGIILLATVLMLLLPSAKAHIWILFTLGILGNVVSGIFNPASGALLPHIVQEDQLQQANAYFAMKSSSESLLGIVLAGILYAALKIQTLFFFVGVCFIASGISEMLIRYEYRPVTEPLTLQSAVSDMREGIQYLKTKRAILIILFASLFINFFATPIMGNFTPFFIKTDLAGAPSYLFDKVLTPELWSSVFEVCFGISSLLGAAILSTRMQEEKSGHKTAVRICVLSGLLILLTICYWQFVVRGVSLNAFLITYSLGFLAIGFMIAWINIPINTLTMRIVDKDKLSKVNSIISLGSQGMVPIASVLGGILLETGTLSLLIFSTLGFSITAVLMLFSRRLKEI